MDRSYIFKNEFEHIVNKHTISATIQLGIKSEIFINTSFLDRQKIFFIKENITLQQIADCCVKHGVSQDFIIDFKAIFEINDDLFMPKELKDKILNNERVAIFIGAGVSKLIGYPLWGELANNAIETLLDKKYINHFEKDKLQYEIKDAKQKLSLFEKFCPRTDVNCKEFYEKNFIKNPVEDNIYDIIASQNFGWVTITSNVDFELKYAIERITKKSASIELCSLLKAGILNPEIPYHLHGSIDKLAGLIFTTEDYLENYYKEKGPVREFLKELFEKYTVIFIGYGLEEFPILEPIFSNYNSGTKHYALFPTYFSEMNLFNIKTRYFKSLNVELLPYYIDFKGYSRLYDVLESWENIIKEERKDDFIGNVNLIDRVVS